MANILAVDDDTAILEMIDTILAKDGHIVTKVSDPLALDLEGLHHFDLILLDIMMSGRTDLPYVPKSGSLLTAPFYFSRQRPKKTVWSTVWHWEQMIIS